MAEDEFERRVNEVRIVIHEEEPLPIWHGTVCQLEAGYELRQCQQEQGTLKILLGRYLHGVQLPAE